MRLWGDADVEEFGLENREAYDAAGNFGEKSDILRYEVCGVWLLACVVSMLFGGLVDLVAPPKGAL